MHWCSACGRTRCASLVPRPVALSLVRVGTRRCRCRSIPIRRMLSCFTPRPLRSIPGRSHGTRPNAAADGAAKALARRNRRRCTPTRQDWMWAPPCIYAAVRAERAAQPIQSFPAFTRDLHALADCLSACQVDTVAMESTGVYWIPVYQILEARGFEVVLVNARTCARCPVARATSKTASGCVVCTR